MKNDEMLVKSTLGVNFTKFYAQRQCASKDSFTNNSATNLQVNTTSVYTQL
jgi:hypothetical protein